MTPRKGFLAILTLISVLQAGSFAFADDIKHAQFGILYGLSVPDQPNTSSFHLTGIHGEAIVTPAFSIGGYHLVSDRTGQTSQLFKFQYSLTGVEAAYHLPVTSGDTFMAFRMGMTKLQMNPSGSDVIYAPYHYGVTVGYDYYWTSWLSLGFEGSYLHVLPGRAFINSTQIDQPSFNLMNFLVALQFRL